jgi:hypothetical protein
MTILFTGSEPDAWDASGALLVSTTAGDYRATYGRLGFAPLFGSLCRSIAWTPVSTTWAHWDARLTAANAETTAVELISAAGQGQVRYAIISNVPTLQSWNGSAWVSLWTGVQDALLHEYDLAYRNEADGFISLYIDGYRHYHATGDYSAMADVDRVSLLQRSANGFWFSQFVVADEPTIGFRVAYREPTGAGNYTAWTGAFGDVDDTSINLTDFISSATAAQSETFTKAIFSAPAGFRVKAVGIAAYARRGSTGPANLGLMLRFGSTDYVSPDKPLELGFKAFEHFWHTNPATGLEWVPADAGSVTVEFGVRSQT